MLSASALDLLILYLGLELMTLCSYILVGIRRERPASNEAAIKYFLLGSFASALLLYGIALVYGVTGATHFAGVAGGSIRTQSRRRIRCCSSALRCSPAGSRSRLRRCLPRLGAGRLPGCRRACCGVSGRRLQGRGSRGTGTGVPGGLRARAARLVRHPGGAGGTVDGRREPARRTQTNMKRLLAYSSIAHAGYALLGLVSGTPEGASATMTYAFIYAFMTLGAFGVVIGLG